MCNGFGIGCRGLGCEVEDAIATLGRNTVPAAWVVEAPPKCPVRPCKPPVRWTERIGRSSNAKER